MNLKSIFKAAAGSHPGKVKKAKLQRAEKPVAVVFMPDHAKRGKVVGRFASIQDAEAFIAKLWGDENKRQSVEAGDYGIDAPEGMLK